MGIHDAYRPADTSVELSDHSIGTLLAERAATLPDRIALVGVREGDTQSTRLTYRNLYSQAKMIAAALTALVPPGSHVALFAPNVLEWPIVEYATALAGMVLVSVNPTLRSPELAYALERSDSVLLIHADSVGGHSVHTVISAACDGLRGVRRISLAQLWAHPAADQEIRGDCGRSDDVAMLQFTSGTTGTPKAAVLNHRAVVNVAKLTMHAAAVPHGAVFLSPLPMFHTAGCVISVLGPLWSGGTLVLIERFDADRVLAAMAQEAVDVVFFVPAMLDDLTRRQRENPRSDIAVRILMGGASALSATLIAEATSAFGASVINLYGQTELAPVLSMTRPADVRADQLSTVGRPLPWVDCKIVDPATGHVQKFGEAGEICARGYQQLSRYWGDADASAAALDEDGFVRTGDLGRMDERGFLTIVGRLKEVIDRGGENISPVEIETVLAGCHGVLGVAVIGLPDERLNQIVAAVVVLDRNVPGPTTTIDDLDTYARERLAPHKVPVRWFVVDELPATSTGKVRRVVLQEAAMNGSLRTM